MSTRATFGHNTARRTRAVGWQTDKTNYGYAVKLPSGKILQIHLTPSDRNHELNVMRALNNAGLKEAESSFSKLNEAERQEKIKKDREDNERRARKLEDELKALRRAAGIKEVPEAVLLSPHLVPRTFERVLVTPALAEKMLEHNTDNRPIRNADVEHWKKIIENGGWRYMHQGIAFDVLGVLQDGQHRLKAIVEAGQPVEMMITVGMPRENFSVIDTNRRRSFGDVVSFHKFGNTAKIGTAARVITLYDDYPARSIHDRVTNAEVDDLMSEHGQMLHDAVAVGGKMWKNFRLNAAGAGAGVFLLWRQFGADDPKVKEFVETLISGVGWDTDRDPRAALRRQLMAPARDRQRNALWALAMFIKTWNTWLEGREVSAIVWKPKVEDFPKVKSPVEE
jgi:hypothetical protein